MYIESHDLDSSQGRRYQDDTVATDKEHGYLSLGCLKDLLISLLVNFCCGDGFFDVAQDHVEMLIKRLYAVISWRDRPRRTGMGYRVNARQNAQLLVSRRIDAVSP